MDVRPNHFNQPFIVQRVFKYIVRRFEIGSYQFRFEIGAVPRPNYAYLVYQAARLAARLGQPRVSILEFGVAGGEGLLALEYHAEQVEKLFPVKIDIYGFDTGTGLPEALDYRDLLYHWKPGFFEMNIPALTARLKRAKLVLGNVNQTVAGFFEEYKPSPIGAVSFDVDFYSSTAMALKIFETDSSHFLPRAFCYFDDIIGGPTELYGDFTGMRLAIREFNENHAKTKLTPIYYLRTAMAAPIWHHQMWSIHFFDHLDYNKFVSEENQQLAIEA